MAFRKKLSAEVKSKIVLKALKERNTANEIASEFQVYLVQIARRQERILREEKTRLLTVPKTTLKRLER